MHPNTGCSGPVSPAGSTQRCLLLLKDVNVAVLLGKGFGGGMNLIEELFLLLHV